MRKKYSIRNFLEGKKFHPIDVFQERWLVTDGKDIFGANGEVVPMNQFKKDMKNIKKYDQYDDIYFPSKQKADEALKILGSEGLEVKKVSYA